VFFVRPGDGREWERAIVPLELALCEGWRRLNHASLALAGYLPILKHLAPVHFLKTWQQEKPELFKNPLITKRVLTHIRPQIQYASTVRKRKECDAAMLD
jgi:hypothetical protein